MHLAAGPSVSFGSNRLLMCNFFSLIVEAAVGGHFLSSSFSRFKIHRTERFITQMNTMAKEREKKKNMLQLLRFLIIFMIFFYTALLLTELQSASLNEVKNVLW